MQIVVLIAFVVVLTLLESPSLAMPAWVFAPALGVYLAVTAAATAVNVRLSLRTLERWHGLSPPVLRRHNLLSGATRGWLVLGLAGMVLMGFGRWALEDLGLRRYPLVGTAAVLTPFLAAVLLIWLIDYPFHRAVQERIAQRDPDPAEQARWTRWQYLAYNVRHQLLFIAVPVGLIILAKDLIELHLYGLLPIRYRDYVAGVGMVVSAGGVFFFAPLLIVRIWRTRRLADGPLREELLALASRLGLRFRDLLVWLSGGMIANAGVMGLVGKVRYVLLSDALLSHMDRAQVRAVFAHEAGHITSHHIFYSVLFAVSSAVLSQWCCLWLTYLLGWPEWIGPILAVFVLGVFWLFGFGWLSRRFERQSDVIAAWVISRPLDQLHADSLITEQGAATFASALSRVAELNGISPRQRNWRHGSIARRISHVLYLAGAGKGRADVDRLVRRIKVGLWLAFVAAMALIGLQALLAWAMGVLS